MTTKFEIADHQTKRKAADNKSICAIGADEYRISSFSLLSFLSQLDIYYLATE